jgi:hypothetical protein
MASFLLAAQGVGAALGAARACLHPFVQRADSVAPGGTAAGFGGADVLCWTGEPEVKKTHPILLIQTKHWGGRVGCWPRARSRGPLACIYVASASLSLSALSHICLF